MRKTKKQKKTWFSALFLECVSLLGIFAVAKPEPTLLFFRRLAQPAITDSQDPVTSKTSVAISTATSSGAPAGRIEDLTSHPLPEPAMPPERDFRDISRKTSLPPTQPGIYQRSPFVPRQYPRYSRGTTRFFPIYRGAGQW